MSSRNRRVLMGGVIILAALAYLIWSGTQEALIYFYTPSELQAKEHEGAGRRIRLGGLVVDGSLTHTPKTLRYEFQLTDGSAVVPVRFKGVPPDLFKEGTGAIVEGQIGADGVFIADLIMAKHNEEYRPPAKDRPSPKELYRSLIHEGESSR
ncbi:MAG: cytochrome c maturation protein CcmE [Candidatus Methylomirabilales bacterium]